MLKEISVLPLFFGWCSLIAVGILCAGCAAITPIAVKTEVVNPSEAGKHAVAVIPDPYMDDLTTAEKLADLVRKEMTQRGFRLSQTEDKADLVIISQLIAPTFENTTPKTIYPPTSINLINPNIGEPGMMQNGGALGELPPLQNQPTIPQSQLELTILAVQEDVWHKALTINQLRIPEVWRISVSVPADFSTKGKEITAEMVEAAGPQFTQLARQ